MRNNLFFLSAVIVLTSFGCATYDETRAQDKIQCDSTNSLVLAECMREREQAALQRMEAAYDGALDLMSEQARVGLRDEQDAWRSYLETACNYFRDPGEFGQEGEIVQFPACRTRIIDDRTAQLDILFRRSGPKE
jgi:uncharacterized protein YecT (DUF1311 family)